MTTFTIILFCVSHISAFVAGALVFRKNAANINAAIDPIANDAAKSIADMKKVV